MDLAAGIAGLISLGIQVTQGIVSYYTAYKGRETEVASTTRKLSRLLDNFKSLRAHLDGRPFTQDENDLKSSIEGAIEDCKDCIDELNTILKKLNECDTASGFRATARLTARKLAYPFSKSTIALIDDNVDYATESVSFALQTLQLKVSDGIKDDIADNKALLKLIQAQQVSSEIRNWLKAPDVSINYNAACKKKHEGTGHWLIESQQFVDWLTKPNSFLWLYGFAGCGKSVLCSTAIQHTLRRRKSNPRIGLAFFFFTFADKNKQDAAAMLRALILQLSSQSSEAHGHLTSLHEDYQYATPPDQALIDCLEQIVRCFDDIYILLDALDESPRDTHRGDLLQALVDIRSWSAHGMHLLVTSRDEIDISKALCDELELLPTERISLKNNGVDQDIASYISGALKTDRRLKKWQGHHDRIKDELTKRAQGVFRWVECQFIALASCPGSVSMLDKLLQSLPQSLHETYERMLLGLDGDTKDDTRRILLLLCCASRPLTVNEVIDAVAVQLGDNPHFDAKGRLFGGDDLLHICPGFIELEEVKSGWRYHVLDNYFVRIAHFSVQEYLESDRIHKNPLVSQFAIAPLSAHMEMTTICVVYLADADEFMYSPDFHFTPYAAQFWSSHYHRAFPDSHHVHDRQIGQNDKGRDPLHQLIFRLFPCIKLDARKWKIRAGEVNKNYISIGSSGVRSIPLVTYLAFHGLHPILADLLQVNPPTSLDPPYISQLVNTPCKDEVPPRAAVFRGLRTSIGTKQRAAYSRTFRFLVNMGASLATDKELLINAAAVNFVDAVQILLDHGANIDAVDNFGQTALIAATVRGSNETVRLLLSSGANVQLCDKYAGTALYVAAERGHSNIVSQLLDLGADVNREGGYYGSALQAAARGGNGKMVTQLLDRGANINIQGGEYGCALQAAVVAGDVSIINLLLDKGSDINLTGGTFGSSLQAAAARGDADLVHLLLQKGANMYEADGKYGTAIHTAAAFGHWEVFQLLLNRGADIDTRGGPSGSFLHSAAVGGNPEIVKFILDRGVGATAITGQYGSVLQAAMVRSVHTTASIQRKTLLAEHLEKTIQLLVAHGADVNARGGVHGSALILAVLNKPKSVVNLLLSLGANVNEQSVKFANALGAAVSLKRTDTAQLLIDHGADINMPFGDHKSIIHMAMADCFTNAGMIQLLLRRGADMSQLSDEDREKIPRILESDPSRILWHLFARKTNSDSGESDMVSELV